MNTIDIVILVLVIAVVLLIIGVYIYKKIKKSQQEIVPVVAVKVTN